MAARNDASIVETDVTIATPDGTCDAAFVHPAAGAHPAVLIWTDAFGLRPSMRAIARRLAAEGYAVLVPNPYYRVARSPLFETASTVDFARDRPMLTPLMASIAAEGTAERDAASYVLWLDARAEVDRTKKIGAHGYCMGGALAIRTAAAIPHRVGAVATFHGGGLVTDQPNSPHHLAPKLRAQVYVAVAANDDQRQPEAKTVLRQAFEAAHLQAEVEVYHSLHGWCVPDMPAQSGHPIYNEPDAERAWTRLLQLYDGALRGSRP